MTAVRLPAIVIICGPTASGKTRFAIELAERVDGEIVGADSLQVYRHLDIGTAKPTDEERARVPHHVIDFLEPDQLFNAARYKQLADEAIADIRSRQRVPLVVGGTGLYLRILVRGIFEAPKADHALRKRLREEIKAYGVEQLYRRLELVDPALAARVEPHDKNRIMRGLEIYEQTGIPLSVHQEVHDFGDNDYRVLKIGLHVPREVLYERIEARSKRMMQAGLPEEYRRLRTAGFAADLKPMLSLGYRQMGDLERGERSPEEALRDLVRETKRYAKRQLTWFRKDPDLHWLDPGQADVERVAKDVRRFLTDEPLALDWTTEAP
jgi:tRNA dimethylallyltransferase